MAGRCAAGVVPQKIQSQAETDTADRSCLLNRSNRARLLRTVAVASPPRKIKNAKKGKVVLISRGLTSRNRNYSVEAESIHAHG